MQCNEHGLGVIIQWDGYIYTECPLCVEKEEPITEPESLVKAREEYHHCLNGGCDCLHKYIRELEARVKQLEGK